MPLHPKGDRRSHTTLRILSKRTTTSASYRLTGRARCRQGVNYELPAFNSFLPAETSRSITTVRGPALAGRLRMERLRVADLHRITTFLTNLYDLADIGRFRRRLLTTLPALVPADRVSVIESNPRESNPDLRHAAGESLPSGAFNGELQRVYGQYMPQSPFIQAYKRGQGSAVKLSDFLTQRQLHRLGLYNEYLR